MKKCSDCGQSHERSSKRCRTCVDKENYRQKKQYQERLSNGLCPRCGQQPMGGNKHCDKCAARVREKDRKVRAKRTSNGLCSHCGKKPPVAGLKTCEICLSKLKSLHDDRVDRLRSSGLCVRCGKMSCLDGVGRQGNPRNVCRTCYLKYISLSNLDTSKLATVLSTKIEDQNYKCPYTGEDLILGVNAWLDHIMPRSRFPKLAKDIGNVEWVTETVNRMKQDRTPEEFLSLIKQIHDHCEL